MLDWVQTRELMFLFTTLCIVLIPFLRKSVWTFLFTGLTPTTCAMLVVFLLSRSIDEMKRLEEMSNMFQSSGVERHPPEPKSQTEGSEDSGGKEQPWEMVMDKKHFKLWRRPITGTHLYQYRGEPCLAPWLCGLWLPSCTGLLFLRLSNLVCSGGFSENLPPFTVCYFSSPS